MSAFSEAALEKKLSELSNSQQSVQTLSLWLIHHRKHSGVIVSVWDRELRKDLWSLPDSGGGSRKVTNAIGLSIMFSAAQQTDDLSAVLPRT
ncbi:unnamed protein product [Ranitomeya imitator]|uniref:CID domain-containing protein n=1 Tax=Ranitomeya imitator TaxID=111125 RepID=A0ABN9M2B5_9NEOB|nr:unnamed protein product [Ranitomeya imitator]